MIKLTVAFKRAVAAIKTGYFIIFRFFSDTANLSDSITKTYGKIASDEASFVDTQEITFGKVASDSASFVDVIQLASSKVLTNSAGASDSGLIRVQNYTTFGYFAEDYVGESLAF